MGCFMSKTLRCFIANPDVPGQGPEAFLKFQRLGLKKKDVDAFYTVFREIDEDNSGHISLREFYRYFVLQQSDFMDAVFGLFDDDNSGEVDFTEFVTSLWNFCSYSLNNLAVFAFSLFDVDGSNRLDMSEVRDLVSAVYGDRVKDNARVERVLNSLDADGDGEITIQEFILYNKQYPLLLWPAYSIQNHLRLKVLGEKFWKDMERYRQDEHRQMNVFEILEVVDKGAKAQIMGVDDPESLVARQQKAAGGGGGGGAASPTADSRRSSAASAGRVGLALLGGAQAAASALAARAATPLLARSRAGSSAIVPTTTIEDPFHAELQSSPEDNENRPRNVSLASEMDKQDGDNGSSDATRGKSGLPEFVSNGEDDVSAGVIV